MLGGVLHCAGQQSIHGNPRVPHFGCERVAEPLLERPQQCRTDRAVMCVSDAICRMPTTEILNDRNELIETIETLHVCREHLHELAALLAHVAFEHPLE